MSFRWVVLRRDGSRTYYTRVQMLFGDVVEACHVTAECVKILNEPPTEANMLREGDLIFEEEKP